MCFFTVSLQIIYKLKISRLFEKSKASENHEEDPFAIERVAFCAESKILCVADASSHVIIYKYQQSESSSEVTVRIFSLISKVMNFFPILQMF